MRRIFRRRVRARLDTGLARTGDVLESAFDRAADVAGAGIGRVGGAVDTVRPAIARALDGAELPGAVRHAVEAGARTVAPRSARARCGRARYVVPAALAVVAAAAICLLVVWRRRHRPDPPPEGASA